MEQPNLTGYPSIECRHNDNTTVFMRHPYIPNLSIYNVVKLLAHSYPNEAAVDCDNVLLTYTQLLNMAETLSRALLSVGVKKGDILTTVLPSNWLAVALFFAANKIGVITTFINTACSPSEIKKLIMRYRSPILFVYDKNEAYIDVLLRDTSVRTAVSVKPADIETVELSCSAEKLPAHILALGNLFKMGENYRCKKPIFTSGALDALILYTSGSTGNPNPSS